jgi:hypothetical protein
MREQVPLPDVVDDRHARYPSDDKADGVPEQELRDARKYGR